MVTMSTPYELGGRTHQKARTRAAMLQATRALLAEGVTPSVEAVAERARVSRTTAYRYFPNQRVLLAATYPEIESSSLLDAAAPSDPGTRLELALERFTDNVLEHEAELRTQLRLSLEPSPPGEALALRGGRAIAWIEDALQPLRNTMSARDVRRLALAIRAACGIEALVWLTDVAKVSRAEAVDIMRSSGLALFRAAITQDDPVDGEVAGELREV